MTEVYPSAAEVCTAVDLMHANYWMIGSTCSIVFIINLIIVIKMVQSMRERERKSKSLIGISVCYMLYCMSYILTFVSIMEWAKIE